MTTALRCSGAGWIDTPDDASLHVTGDIDIRFAAALTDWTPASLEIVLRKTLAVSQASFQVYVSTDGKLNLQWSDNGGASLNQAAASTVAPTVTDGALLLCRVTLDVDNGAAGRDIKFYTKTSTFPNAFTDISSDSGWTQLGTTVTQAGTTSIFAGTAALKAAATESATFGVIGQFLAAVIKNGIAGTTVTNPNCTAQTPGATSFVDGTGKTWTLHGDATLAIGGTGVAVTQDYTEVASSSSYDERITQDYTELLSSAEVPHSRVTQDYTEVLSSFDMATSSYTGREPVVALGCGSYRVMLTERGGGNPIAFLPFNQLSWNRTVDDVGSASITVPLAGQLATDECCAALTRADSFDGEVDSWSHEISVIRDGQLVFVGPIVGMVFSFTDVQIECRDLFGWFDKRRLPVTRDVISDLAQIFETFAQDALDQEPSPNITLIGYATNTVNRRTIKAVDFIKAGTFLRELGKDGVDFAMVGRTLYFGNLDNLAIDLKADLALPQYAVVDGKLEKRGLESATEFTLTGQPPGGAASTIHATVGGKDSKYGLLQESQSESFITVPAFLKFAAQSRLAMIKRPPRYLDVTLDPKAPFTVNELVASFLIHVNLQIGCAQVAETMRIHQVQGSASVDDKGEETEAITLTIVPQGDPHGTLGFPLGFEFS